MSSDDGHTMQLQSYLFLAFLSWHDMVSIIQAHCAQVRECLLALPQKKWVFTNCNEKHAKLALETLQLQVMLSPIHPPRGYDFIDALACRNSKTCSPVP